VVGGSRRAWQVPVVAALLALGGAGCQGVGGAKECGGPGQPCCADASCDPGLACGDARCTAPRTFSIGGTVAGLTAPGLVLRNNGQDPLTIQVGGPFTFAAPLPTGSPYAVTVSTQPPGQTCTVANGSGTVGTANVTGVLVTCSNLPVPTYRVGGSVTGLAGSGLVLQNNGGDNLPLSADGPFTFATALVAGDHYGVTVLEQPAGQSCTVANGSGAIVAADVTGVAVSCVSNPEPRFTIGGTVSGLSGAGLVLRNNGGDALPITANGAFTFATALPTGTQYVVTVAGQPANPSQTCTVSRGSGTVASSNVTSVAVSCVTNPVPRYTIGGTASGVAGPGLVLQNNGGDDLSVPASGSFTFATPLTSGSAYAVTVFSQPSGQTCGVSGGSGTLGNANVTSVAVSCITNPPPRYTIGGTVSGLSASGLVLRNNGADGLAIATDGSFTFATPLTSGSGYSVTVFSQPSGQTCTVSGGSGTVGNANVTSVAVSCITNRYTIGGTVTGLTGSGLVLRNNGGDDLSVPANGSFTFATSLTVGSSYSVTVFSQPSGQTCSVSAGSGTVGTANVTSVAVSCANNPPPRYTIGGSVGGLTGSGLVLRNNGGDDLSISSNGAFTFATTLTSGSSYSVTVFRQPSGQACTVSGGSGTVGNANVTSVAVSCANNPPPRYTVGGNVTGLTGSGLVLQNNGGDDLSISSNGGFTFATALTSGSSYSVTVRTQPSGQSCTVSGGSGTVGNANVTSVAVSCANNPPPPTQPTLVQHVSSSTNILGRGLTANDFRLTLPNPVGAGNVLVLGISYGAPGGKTATVRDNLGNGWPGSPTVSATNPGRDIASAIFVLPNARPGVTTITISFNSPIDNTIFQYTISEFSGVATTAPVSGTSSASGRQPALSAGTFTPAGNDANGGNLVWSYFADASGATSDATQANRFTAGPGATLLDADIATPTGAPPFPHASQYQLQPAAGPITPSMSAAHLDGGGDEYVGVAVALKAFTGAGTPPPPGLRIVHLSHLTNQSPDVGAWRLQFPSSGNLVVLTMQETNIIPVASVTDNLGNGYVHLAPDDSVPQFWIAQGPARTDPTLELTVDLTGGRGGGVTYLLYDVAGASASSYDGFAFKTQYNDPGGTDVSDSPVITPPSAPGLTITATSFGQGPSSGLASGCPVGAIFDFVYYTGETDLDTMDNADFRAHVLNSDLSTQHWNIAVSNGNRETDVSSTAAHFR
jgi:hypothetical protein